MRFAKPLQRQNSFSNVVFSAFAIILSDFEAVIMMNFIPKIPRINKQKQENNNENKVQKTTTSNNITLKKTRRQ